MSFRNALIFLVVDISGGTATLSYRIGCEFIKHEYDVFFLCKNLNDDNNLNLFKKSKINIIHCDESKWRLTLFKLCECYDSVIAITYSYNYFYNIYNIRNKTHKLNGYLYVVHTNALVRGFHTNNVIIRKIGNHLNSINKSCVAKMYRNNQILFMDQLTVDFTTNNLNLSFPNVDKKVFLLPYCVSDFVDLNKSKDNIIVTMARISFPFKGYIIGLIDVFAKLAEKHNSMLWIIGDGESMTDLKLKIEAQEPDIQKRIRLFYNVSYDKIGDILKQAKIFVGMGTSILDAVAQGIPSIPIQSYTYECRGKDFFNKAPQCIGYEKNDCTLHDISKLIEDTFSMEDSEYRKFCYDNFVALKNNYSTEEFYKRLIKLRNGNEALHIFDKIGYMSSIIAFSFYQFIRK